MTAFVTQLGPTLVRVPARASVCALRAARSRFVTGALSVALGGALGVALGGARTRVEVPGFRSICVPSMRVAKDGETVEVHYTGTLEDGSEFDSSRTRGLPLSFTLGEGSVVPGFEKAVKGMAVDERKNVSLVPEEAYGLRSEKLLVNIPRERVAPEMKLESGQVVPLSNGGRATVLEITDTEVKLDANHPLAGETLNFDLQLVGILDSVLPPPAPGLERFVCAAGCFWGIELAFQREPGVISTKVGYTQGRKKNPSYREVCSGITGHTEGVAVDFDPSKTSYEKLLALFWERLGRSALTLNKVGNDVGTQYRSGVYYLNEEQKQLAMASKERVAEELAGEVVAEILPATGKPFYTAEEYHQRYLEKGGQSAEKGEAATIRCYG